MQSEKQDLHSYYRLDASALSGFLTEPFQKNIPTLAPTALPQAGGFATARTGAFNLDELVSASSAYTVVTARRSEDGSTLALATAVIEDLNILEIVTARRIVAQITVVLPKVDPQRNEPRRISLAGSRFEGLRVAGHEGVARLSRTLQPIDSGSDSELPLLWRDFLKKHEKPARLPGFLVEGFAGPEGNLWGGHIIKIPGYGEIILGQLDVTHDSVQLISIRAVLGCQVGGVVTGPTPMISGGGASGGDH
jgi:hypothetical protein